MHLPNILDTLRIQDTGSVHLYLRREEHSGEKWADDGTQDWVVFYGGCPAHLLTWNITWGKGQDSSGKGFFVLITGIRNTEPFRSHGWKRRQWSPVMAPKDAKLVFTFLCNLLYWVWSGLGILQLINARVGRIYNIFVINTHILNNPTFANENLFLTVIILVNRPLLWFENKTPLLTLNMLICKPWVELEAIVVVASGVGFQKTTAIHHSILLLE